MSCMCIIFSNSLPGTGNREMGLKLLTSAGLPSFGRGTTLATFQACGTILVEIDKLKRKVNVGTRIAKAFFKICEERSLTLDDFKGLRFVISFSVVSSLTIYILTIYIV